jgi:hypothetical protein
MFDEPSHQASAAKTLNLINSLPPTAQAKLLKLLHKDENIVHLERVLFWPSNGATLVASLIGTAAFSVLIFLLLQEQITIGGNLFVLFATFPLTLGVCIYSLFKNKQSFVAFTDSRLIISPGGFGAQVLISYKDMTSVSHEFNYLFWRKEVLIKRINPRDGRNKVSYLDSIKDLDFYEEFLNEKVLGNNRITLENGSEGSDNV